MTKKWEYLAVDLYPYAKKVVVFIRAPDGHNHLEKPLLEWLNEFGEEGWEMVALTTGYGSKSKSGSSGRYTFKRKIV